MKINEPLKAHWYKAGFLAPQTVSWIQKVQFTKQAYVVKSPPISKPLAMIKKKRL
jgi:hypothetical protein